MYILSLSGAIKYFCRGSAKFDYDDVSDVLDDDGASEEFTEVVLLFPTAFLASWK